jgi:hypothetical protein
MTETKFCDCTGSCARQGPNFFCPYVPEGFAGYGTTCKLLAKTGVQKIEYDQPGDVVIVASSTGKTILKS